jgi:hypothetical protein
MNEVLLQTIVEKLEALELAWKVSGDAEKERLVRLNNDIESLRQDVKKLPVQITSTANKLEQLKASVDSHYKQRQSPAQNQVEHKHELHKGITIAVALFFVTIVLTWLLLNAYQTNKQFVANDLKYRSLKLSANKAVLKLCNITDSLYQNDHVSFKNQVEQEEQRLIQQAEDLRLAGEKEREAKFLKNRAGRR